MIEELLRSARKLLQDCNCDRACHACLLDFGTQHHAEHLNRNSALAFIDDRFFAALQVPKKFCAFGDSTLYEPRGVVDSMLIAMAQRTIRSVSVYVKGHAETWDVDNWPMWRHLARIATPESGIQSRLIITAECRRQLRWSSLHALVSKAAARETKVFEVADAVTLHNGCHLAGVVESRDNSQAWGVFDAEALGMCSTWGQGSDEWPVIKGAASVPGQLPTQLDLSSVERERPENCAQIFIQTELNGDVSNLVNTFWPLLSNRSAWLCFGQTGSVKRKWSSCLAMVKESGLRTVFS